MTVTKLRGRCRTAADGRRTSAGTQVNEVVNQLAQSDSGKSLAEARGANDILSADPGEMGKTLARVTITEYKPRVAFVGHPTVGLKGEPDVAQARYHAMELRKFVIGPPAPAETHIG